MSGGIRGYVPALDGLRAIAVGLVMLGHLWHGPELPILQPLVSAGFHGVDVFFALSGFLITGILLRNLGQQGYYRNFFVRRALRILPLYWCYLTLVLGPRLVQQLSGAQVPESGPFWVYYVFVSNLNFVHEARFIDPLLDMSWSLCIEEQFYLTFPLLVAALPRRALVVLLVVIAVGSGPLRYAVYDPNNELLTYVSTPMRSDGLAMGALAAIALHHEHARLIVLIRGLLWPLTVLLGVALGVGYDGHQPGPTSVMHTLVSAWSTCVLVAVISGEHPALTRYLAWTPAVLVGRLSYGLYLLHPAAYVFVCFAWARADLPAPEHSVPSASAQLLMASLIAIGMATLTWRTLEEPMLGLKDRLAPSRP